MLFSAHTLFAQHDLSISLNNSTGLSQVGDTTIFNLRLNNVNQTDVTGLSLQLIISETLEFVEANPPNGTTYSDASGVWDVNNQLTNNIDELDLVLRFVSNEQGTHFFQAEISTMDGFDFNSTPANSDVLEDDIAVGCLIVPVEIGTNDTVQLSAPMMIQGGHVWSRTTDMGTMVVSNAMLYDATEIGRYSYSNDLLECNPMSCCDIVLIEQNNELEICDNGLDDDNDGSVDCFDSDCPCETPTYPCVADALEDIPISTPNLSNLNNPDYTIAHVLLDIDGNIVEVANATAQNFAGVQPGIYYSYSLSYLTTSGITGLNIGSNIANVDSPTIEWTAPDDLFICPAIVVNDILITPCDGNFYYVIFTHLYEVGLTGTEDFNIQGQMFTEILDGSGSQQFVFQIACGDVNLPPVNNPGTITGTVFQECNDSGTGIRNEQEQGFSEFFVSLTGTDFNGNLVVLFDEIDAVGVYLFENIPTGTYQVVINTDIPDFGWQISPLNQGTDDTVDSDIDPNSGYSEVLTINGNAIIGLDAGLMDIQTPQFADVPSDVTYNCNESIPDTVPTATDNNELLSVILTEATEQGDCPQNETLTRTWTATDVCGNVNSVTQQITITDNKAPVLTGVPANTSMSCSEASNPIMPTATDNCDTNVEVSMTETQTGSGCSYQLIRTWTATDDCDNSSTSSQTIVIEDNEAPVIVPTHPLLVGLNSGDEITVKCNTPFILNPTDATVTDDCDNNVEITIEEEEIIVGDCLTDGFLVWMHCYFEATDDCGNTSQFFVKIRIVDTTAPVFFGVPANTTIDCNNDLPIPVTPVVSDNCTNSSDLNIVYSEDQQGSGCNYQIIRTWTATDDCGNTGTTNQTITIQDNEAPIFTNTASSTTVECAADIPVVSTPLVSDNCNSSNLNIVYSEEQQGNGCNYQIIRTWTATDDCGNTGITSQTITIQDNEAPIIMGVGNDVTVDLSIGEIIPSIPTNIIANDNCATDVELTFNETQEGEACSYQLIRTWNAVDACGNTSTETQTITILDELAEISATTTADNCEMLTGTANLSPTSYTYTWSNGLMGASQANLVAGTYTVTATNATACTSTFEIVIEAACDCIEFGIEQEIYTNATCNDNNGTATIIPEENITDYTYTWLPNVGTSNPMGNSHTDLPAGDYLVIILFQGNPECEEKVEFTIDNDLSDCGAQLCMEEIIEEEIINIEVFNPNDFTSICLPITTVEASAYNIYLNEVLYSNALEACADENFVFYSYALVEEVDENSSYNYSWDYPEGTISGTVANIEELVLVMNSVTENQVWEHRTEEEMITIMQSIEGYGNLTITHSENNITTSLQANSLTSSTGTEILVQGVGTYNLTLENPLTTCIDEVEIVVTQNLSPPVSADFLVLSEETISYDCNEEDALLCIDIPYSDFMRHYAIKNNGLPYSGETTGCNFTRKYAYNYASVADYGNLGPYFIYCEINGVYYSAEVNNIYTITAQLNLWDIEGNWHISEDSFQIVGGVIGNDYGKLNITQSATGIVSNLALNNSYTPMSTQLNLPPGINELILINESKETQDELTIRVACVTTDRIENTILLGQEDEMCLDTDELLGEIVSVENICESEGSTSATIEIIDGTSCISCTGDASGVDEACFVICDEYGICDTTYLQVTVLERSIEDEQSEVIVYSGFSPNGDNINDTFTITGLEDYTEHSLIIFNRWGQKVFNSENYQNNWEGTYESKDLPDGTYFYILNLDDTKTECGYIQIIR